MISKKKNSKSYLYKRQLCLKLCSPHPQIKGSILRERRKEVDNEEEEGPTVLCCVTQNSK